MNAAEANRWERELLVERERSKALVEALEKLFKEYEDKPWILVEKLHCFREVKSALAAYREGQK